MNMKSPENVVNLLSVDPIEFEFGYGLIPLVDANQGGDLLRSSCHDSETTSY